MKKTETRKSRGTVPLKQRTTYITCIFLYFQQQLPCLAIMCTYMYKLFVDCRIATKEDGYVHREPCTSWYEDVALVVCSIGPLLGNVSCLNQLT